MVSWLVGQKAMSAFTNQPVRIIQTVGRLYVKRVKDADMLSWCHGWSYQPFELRGGVTRLAVTPKQHDCIFYSLHANHNPSRMSTPLSPL